MKNIGIVKKLKDEAHKIVQQETKLAGIDDVFFIELFESLVFYGLKQGFFWGVKSMKETSDLMLSELKRDDVK